MTIQAVKFTDEDNGIIEGWGIPYGGPFKGKDLQGEYFSAKTDLCDSWFSERPLVYHHGIDPDVGPEVVGRVKTWDRRDKGVWVKTQLDRQSRYFEGIKELIAQDALYFSSGSIPHLVKANAKSGEILCWPWIELSLTPTPSNLYATLGVDAAKSHFKSAGIDTDFEALKAAMDAADRDALSDSDFAYIDNDGNRHLPIHDAAHVRNALARFDQTHFESDAAKSAAHAKVMAAAKKFGIDTSEGSSKSLDPKTFAQNLSQTVTALKDHTSPVASSTYVEVVESIEGFLRNIDEQERLEAERAAKSMEGSYEDLIEDLSSALNPESPFGAPAYSCIVATFPDSVIVCRYDDEEDGPTYWKVGYTMGDDGDPVLGKAEQVEQTYVPVKSMDDAVPLTLDASMLSRRAAALVQRTEGLHERRVKEGRTLSVANRQRLADAVKTLDEARNTLASLLDESQKMTEDQAKAKALASPDGLRRRLAALDLLVDTLPEEQQPA